MAVFELAISVKICASSVALLSCENSERLPITLSVARQRDGVVALLSLPEASLLVPPPAVDVCVCAFPGACFSAIGPKGWSSSRSAK